MLKDLANVEQARSWDAEEGDHWTDNEAFYNNAVARHHIRFLEAARIGAGDRVLDVGCGCGESTRDAARAASSGSALGVDLSARMLQRARERSRAEGLRNVRFEQADAQVHPFEAGAFDLVMSRFGAMFFADPVAAFSNLHQALRPGGRLALISWQPLAKNEWLLAVRGALSVARPLPDEPTNVPGPFGLADPAATRRTLESAGFQDVDHQSLNVAFCLGPDVDTAFESFTGTGLVRSVLAGVDDKLRAAALDGIRATFAAHATPEGVLYDSAAWIITARRP